MQQRRRLLHAQQADGDNNRNTSSFGVRSFLVPVISGGCAATVSRTVVNPLERLKIIYQVQRQREFKGIISSFAKIWRQEGVAGFFRGNGANALRAFPYGAVQFATFHTLKQHRLSQKRALAHDNLDQYTVAPIGLSNTERLVFGAVSGATSVSCTYPLDIARTRLSIQTANLSPVGAPATTTIAAAKQRLPGLAGTVRSIYTNEGGFRGLYRGLSATLLNIVPYTALNFCAYEWARSRWCPRHAEPSSTQKLLFGGLSGFFAQTIVFPLEVLRRRFQVNWMQGIGHHYPSIRAAITTIYREEGILAFFKGYASNMCKIIPLMSVTWFVYDTISNLGISTESK
ncbi:coenzyme A/diphosphate transporter [Schizosaccharomyces japonicus yFS275]|uniref:Coenzyme A/diphosphate transporter n=1 Tax=Schizosaccharomyces japonicus (strain yFS275 / FY16936) TaxID=402676 RepID=B6K3Y7_SCHJY|nr:coenzyme A/diphosphate transporter [Schizosaccharomyces japonicus yFS275]EEB08194.1 coenzyme A/diphosphate transporter [Schizosaccharomyces japonicus yFS275]